MKEQVPAGPGSKMEWITWYLPLAVIVIVAASKRSFHDIHNGVLGLAASRAIMRLTVEFVRSNFFHQTVDCRARLRNERVRTAENSSWKIETFVLFEV